MKIAELTHFVAGDETKGFQISMTGAWGGVVVKALRY